ncbi:IS1 family transposase, partial [Escherichia coli]
PMRENPGLAATVPVAPPLSRRGLRSWHPGNLRQHLARLGRKSLSFSKSVELHDKVIGHYLNIKHYQ